MSEEEIVVYNEEQYTQHKKYREHILNKKIIIERTHGRRKNIRRPKNQFYTYKRI